MTHHFVIVLVDPAEVGIEPGANLEETFKDPAVCEAAGRAVYDQMIPYNVHKKETPARKMYLSQKELAYIKNRYRVRDEEKVIGAISTEYGYTAGKDNLGYHYLDNHNFSGMWDWYNFGGRWEGLIRLNTPEMVDGEATLAYRREKRLEFLQELDREPTPEELELFFKTKPNPAFRPELVNTYVNNAAWASDVPDNLMAFAVITPGGEWYTRTAYEDWPQFLKRLLSENAGALAFGLDIHIE